MVNYSKLSNWGLKENIIAAYEASASADGLLGRIIEVQKGKELVVTEEGTYWCSLSGRYRYEYSEESGMPTVGDWVEVSKPISEGSELSILKLLDRTTKFSRKVAGTRADEQLIAANIDLIFICMALNADFNLRRLERYVSLAWQSGATPVIVLTKSDLSDQVETRTLEVTQLFVGIDVYTTCGFDSEDIDRIRGLIPSGKTAVFTGSSGVGKSTLINGLIGAHRQETKALRNDDQGRHTTTYRELILLEGGGILVDTPGMREIGLLGDEEEGLSKSFADVEELMTQCKFKNCTHTTEQECKVLEALDEGTLDTDRYENYRKLLKESEYMQRKNDKHSQKSYMRAIGKRSKARKKVKY